MVKAVLQIKKIRNLSYVVWFTLEKENPKTRKPFRDLLQLTKHTMIDFPLEWYKGINTYRRTDSTFYLTYYLK